MQRMMQVLGSRHISFSLLLLLLTQFLYTNMGPIWAVVLSREYLDPMCIPLWVTLLVVFFLENIMLLLLTGCSLCCFLLFSLPMWCFLLFHKYVVTEGQWLCWWAQLCPTVGPLQSQLEPAMPGMGQPLASSLGGHPCNHQLPKPCHVNQIQHNF